MYLCSYGGVLSSHDQVNMADWTLESWLAVKGAASPKVENLDQIKNPILVIFVIFPAINLISMIIVRNGLDRERGSNCDGPRPSEYAQLPI